MQFCNYTRAPSPVLTGLSLLLIIQTSFAQKITKTKVWTKVHQPTSLPLAPTYKTYSVEYDFGNLAVPVTEPPKIQELERTETGGDLLLRITNKNLVLQQGGLESSKFLGKESFTYPISYTAEYGYELLDPRQNNVLTSFKRTGGKQKTQSFTSQAALDAYMKNQFTSELIKSLLQTSQRRIHYLLSDHLWEAQLTLVKIEGEAPEYQQINQATDAFLAALQGATANAGQLRPLVAGWEAQLAKADWETKKAVINRKAANALLTNLCAAYLVLEDYAALKAKATLFTSRNTGAFGALAPSFEVDNSFTGPVYRTTQVYRDRELREVSVVQFADLAQSLFIGK